MEKVLVEVGALKENDHRLLGESRARTTEKSIRDSKVRIDDDDDDWD